MNMMAAGNAKAFMIVALTVAIMVAGSAIGVAQVSSLVKAVRQLDRSSIDDFIQQGVDVSTPAPDGTTALHWAAHHGDLEIVHRLIDAGGDVSAPNRYGIAPIWLAAQNGHADVVETFLRAGVDPETTRGDSGETVLMIAARAGHVDVLQQLIAFTADVNARELVRGQTALMWAAAERHRDAVKLLAGAGADLEARSNFGMTPFMFAIRGGDIDVIQEMLDQGADLATTGPDGTTALVLAIINAHWELAAYLLDMGADPNANDPLHGSPLHALTFMRRAENRGLSAWLPRSPTGNIDSIELAEALLGRGAGINDRLNWKPGQTPQHMAHGMFPGTGYDGATPFFIASKNCDVEFMKFLLAAGADPSISTSNQVTPLLAAAGVGYVIGESPGTPEEALEAVRLLHGVGNDVEAVAFPSVESQGSYSYSEQCEGQGGGGWGGGTALHGAVVRGAEGLVKWLIAQGVRLDYTMTCGTTALDVAEGSSLGINYNVQPELAAIIREAMLAQGNR